MTSRHRQRVSAVTPAQTVPTAMVWTAPISTTALGHHVELGWARAAIRALTRSTAIVLMDTRSVVGPAPLSHLVVQTAPPLQMLSARHAQIGTLSIDQARRAPKPGLTGATLETNWAL